MSLANLIEHNGDGNPKLIGFSSDKDVRATLSSALFDNRALALLTGNSIKVGSHPVYRREVTTVTTGSATLPNTPKDGELLALYVLGVDGVEAEELEETTDYTLTGKEITVTGTDDGTTLIAYYMIDTPESSQTITVSSDAFPGAFKMVMEVLVTDFHTKKLYPAQIIVPSAQMEDSWALSFAPDGDPAPMDMPIEILKSANSNDMFTLTIYSDEDLT